MRASDSPGGYNEDTARCRQLSCLESVEHDLAYWDDLTGLYNKRLLSRLLDEWWNSFISEHDTFSLIVIDLDGFKDVNDSYGHLTGDQVLRETARILKSHFRSNDVVIRYGGDEFVVVLPGAGTEEADLLAERARTAISEHQFSVEDDPNTLHIAVSFSVGIASFPDGGSNGIEVLKRADLRLYADKRKRQRSFRKRHSAWWNTGIAVALLLVAFVAIKGFDFFFQPSPEAPTIPTTRPTQSNAREGQLIAQIEELRSQLDELSADRITQIHAEDEPSVKEIDRLNAKIRTLQEELSDLAAIEREPTPTPAPIVVVASPTVKASPVTLGQKTPTAPTPTVPPLVIDNQLTPIVVPPVLIGYDKPRYPRMALRLRKEAAIRLEVVVDASGRVVEVHPLAAEAGLGFDAEAQKAAFSARYEPGTIDGEPAQTKTVLVIHFKFSDNSP